MLRTLRQEHLLIRARVTVAAVAAAMVMAACAQASTVDPRAGADTASPAATATPATTASATPTPVATAQETTPAAGTASAAALDLTVKGRAPKTGYERDLFGSGWVDVDRNGCDTRNDMLRLRLTDRVMSGECTVLEGSLEDPFTGTTVRFERGGASEVDVDHLVALSDAWQKGAATWEFAKRVAFANDPLNLEPVDAGANRAKGDGDAATWLPPHRAYRCEYVARQIAVKAKYDVWVTEAERDAMLRVLEGCPAQVLPGPGDQPVIADNVGRAPEPRSTPLETPDPAGTSDSALDPDMGTCKAAIAAGYGPYVRGEDPEYDYYRDGDGDGEVCE